MKALVLCSGGVDSTTCLGMAVKEFGSENVATVTAYYGQRHSKEILSAKDVCSFYGVENYEIDLSEIFSASNCPLIATSKESIIHKSYAEQIEENGEGAVDTYVPFRNGLLLSAVASLGMSIFPGEEVLIYIGAHADDSAGEAYPDCSVEFIELIGQAINSGTYGMVSICAPFVFMNKAEVVRCGLELGVPYGLTWSCYEGGEEACGTCGTCIDRINAFKKNGVTDPIKYKEI